MSLFISLLGIIILLGIAYLLSANRKAIRWRTVGGAFAIQAGIGAVVLYFPWGKDALAAVAAGAAKLTSYYKAGTAFVFGPLANTDVMRSVFGAQNAFLFAVEVLPVIIFFSSLITVLYHLGIMGAIIRFLGGALQKVLGSSRTESMSATANIFVGQTEAPLVVKPFIPHMTRSELFAIMVGGVASVAGSVMFGYAQMGIPLKYLIAASFMAAPGGLLMAKMLEPETEQPREDLDEVTAQQPDKPVNVIDAAATGAASGLQLAINVGGMLLAFVALIALLDGMIGGIGGWFGYPGITLEQLLGYAFSPLAYILGIPWHEAVTAGSFIGEKFILNEFVAYLDFQNYLEPVKAAAAGVTVLSDRSQVIITFALCGFANLSSVAILLGGIGGMAPTRRHEIAQLGMKAIIAGSLSNFMSAVLAGFFFTLSL